MGLRGRSVWRPRRLSTISLLILGVLQRPSAHEARRPLLLQVGSEALQVGKTALSTSVKGRPSLQWRPLASVAL